MAKTLSNIIYDMEEGTPIVDSPDSMFMLQFEKGEEYFSNLESRNRFIKKTEQMVRQNIRYKAYVDKIKKKVKLNRCQVIRGLTTNDCTIEMHHGPIFTLYDYCDIIINHYLEHKWKITTFKIAKTVLDEHWKDRIQIVMLSSTVHEEVHDREIFISTEAAFGNLHRFLKKYKLSTELKEKYNRYLDKCAILDSTAYEVLQLNEKLFR